MRLTGLLLANGRGEPQPGAVLDRALARARADEAREAREAAASAPDPDERAASLIARGVMPGQVSELSQRLGDTMAELQAEREKIEKGERRQEQVRRMHQNGQISAFEIQRMLDGDFGDLGKVAKLERRAERLARQIREVSALIPRAEDRPADPLEAASRAAREAGHEAFREVTRSMFAAAQAGLPVRPAARPPFAGPGGVAVRSEVTCAECIALGVTGEESFRLHAEIARGAEGAVR